jgi:hypothetical protein
LPPWIVPAALLAKEVMVAPDPFDTPSPPRVRPPFPTAALPLIAPLLVSVPIMPELPTPEPPNALVEPVALPPSILLAALLVSV